MDFIKLMNVCDGISHKWYLCDGINFPLFLLRSGMHINNENTAATRSLNEQKNAFTVTKL